MRYREALEEGTAALEKAQIDTARLDAWYLLEHVCHITRQYYYLHDGESLKDEEQQEYELAIRKRAERVPLQYITGEQEFMGMTFKVNPSVLIPRQDTEILVEEILKLCKPEDRVLDLCTGSGCILLSIVKLAAELKGCREITGTGVDLSEKALKIAQENRRNLGLEQTTALLQSDLFERVNGTYDMIVSNPPYIASEVIATLSEEVKDHEPMMALDGGTDGLDFYRIMIEKSPAYLAPKGMLFFEIGYDQGASVSQLMEKDFENIHVIQDLAGLDRVVSGCYRRNRNV